MKSKILVSSMALISLLAVGFLTLPARAVSYGPKASNLLIHVYSTQEAEFDALDAGTIDIVDWPLTKTYVDRWAGSTTISMRSYAELGHMEIDINNQRWPTGVETPRSLDAETGTYKHYFDPTSQWDLKAAEFRKAIAYLTDKEGYATRILKGFAYAQDTNVPYPEAGGWVPPEGYVSTVGNGVYSPISFSPATAASVLDAAGFTQGSTVNPYWDSTQAWSAHYLRTDPKPPGGNLLPLVFYIRMDDSNRRDAGRELTTMLRKSGIQVNPVETERTVCYKQAMVLYDYHLYTGGWSLSADAPDSLYFLAHAAQYWGGTSGSYYGGTGWSSNYAGFADGIPAAGTGTLTSKYDYWAEKSKYPATKAEALLAGREAQVLETKLVPMVPLWAAAAVKAYRTAFTGVINSRGYGTDNYWSFLNMYNPGDSQIDWGFKSNLEGPNPICSEWVWDWNILGLIYDSLIGRNPFNLAEECGWLAKDWQVYEWTPGKLAAKFQLRTAADSPTARDPVFHNGDPVRPIDVAFTLMFQKDCGAGVAWVYSDIKDLKEIRVHDLGGATWLSGHPGIVVDTGLAANEVEMRFNVKSYWALHWAGMQIVMNERILKAANDALGWGYMTGAWDRMKVREYQPWAYDSDLDGTVDLKEDGTGAWVFESAAPLPISTSTALAFSANSNFYLSQDYISNYLKWAFHLAGDVNDDAKVDIADGLALAKALGTDPSWVGTNPPGVVAPPWEWNEYNPDGDIDVGTWNFATGVGTYGNAKIDVFDINQWGRSYGLKE